VDRERAVLVLRLDHVEDAIRTILKSGGELLDEKELA
jgi:hypothetical protein